MDLYENMTKINYYKRHSKDYLRIFVHLTYGLIKMRNLKLCLLIPCLLYAASMIFGVYTYLCTLDPLFIYEYGPTWGIQVFMTMNLWIIFFSLDIFAEFFIWHEKIRIPYEVMNEKLLQKVENISKLVKLIVFVNYTLAALSLATLETFNHKYLFRRSHMRQVVCSKLPGPCWIKLCVVSFADLISGTVMASGPTALIYFGVSGIFRLMLINEFVSNITSSKIPDDQKYDSELYQKIVEQKLKICVLLHDQAISNSISAARMIYLHMIMFSLVSVILGVSLMFAFMQALDDREIYAIIGLQVYIVCVVLSAILYVSVGQVLKNESERMWFILIQLPWYHMNRKNLQIYSVLLRKSEKPIALSTDLLEINFLLFVRIIRGLYTIAAFVMQMRT